MTMFQKETTMSYVLKKRKYTKELYESTITPSQMLKCGIPAEMLAFYIIKSNILKKEQKKSIR